MMGIRTTFDPLLGSQRLIFAFEAVIIGGMGSSWGTLLGGIILGLGADPRRPGVRLGVVNPCRSRDLRDHPGRSDRKAS